LPIPARTFLIINALVFSHFPSHIQYFSNLNLCEYQVPATMSLLQISVQPCYFVPNFNNI
jgi:hypothetical protein